jgi:heptosyltransferase-2
MKPKLLVVQLWQLGDLVMATPFLQAAREKFEVTLVAKPFAHDLQKRFWPEVKVVPFVAPWTAFEHKYQLFRWSWRELYRLIRTLAPQDFDFGLSARWDPRDHLLLTLARARNRLGFGRMGSQRFLTQPLSRPEPQAHQYENWRALARALEVTLPSREKLRFPEPPASDQILVHTGAGQPVRVWPLDRYRNLVARLRRKGHRVRVVCDPDQKTWWRLAGENDAPAPRSVTELMNLLAGARLFIGNDSGPGHLAALCGVPTFTIFGPQLTEWFAPLHPAAECVEGEPCPYKPCSDYCRFSEPVCLRGVSEEKVWAHLERFVQRHLAVVAA